jgi:protein-S-isoprenylcysteine O-methyltransferase Ste14
VALVHSLESSGNFLFRYRGQIPVALFIMAIPVIYFTDYDIFYSSGKCAILITAIALSFLGLVIRSIAIGMSAKHTSGRNTKKQVAEALNTTGIYSTMRHPLYVGNYFMWIGIVLFTFNFYFVIIVTLMYWLYYERIMFAEERFLERKFGQSYVDWSMGVPPFIPSFKNYIKSDISFSMKTVLRREYSGVLATVIGFLYVDLLRNFIEFGYFKHSHVHLFTLIGAFALVLVLRSLKKYTRVLHEEDRS